jgi:hypothetical protein
LNNNNSLQDKAWNQQTFETLLVEWIVACDQPFEEVDCPEFQKLLEYMHFQPSLWIPHHGPIHSCIMKMGEDTVQGVQNLIMVTSLIFFSMNFTYIDVVFVGAG